MATVNKTLSEPRVATGLTKFTLFGTDDVMYKNRIRYTLTSIKYIRARFHSAGRLISAGNARVSRRNKEFCTRFLHVYSFFKLVYRALYKIRLIIIYQACLI